MRAFLFCFVIVILSFIISTPLYAVETVAQPFLIKGKLLEDERTDQLRVYLAMKRSPLLPYTETLIATAYIYNLPWNLIPAISGVESNFCKVIPRLSHNCWGWNNGNYTFENYESAIETVGKTLRQKYFDQGLDTPEKMNLIYATSVAWASNVRFFMNRIAYFQAEPHDPATELSLTL